MGKNHKKSTKGTKQFRTFLIGTYIFILVTLLFAVFAVFSIDQNNTDSLNYYTANIFLVGLVLNFILPIARETLINEDKRENKIIYYNIITSLPTWITIAVTSITIYSSNLMPDTLNGYDMFFLILIVGLILFLVIFKFCHDYKSDIRESYVEQVEKDTFTAVEKSSIPKESLVKTVEKPVSKESKSSQWLYFFLLSLILLQYFFLKNPKKK